MKKEFFTIFAVLYFVCILLAKTPFETMFTAFVLFGFLLVLTEIRERK